MPFACHNLQRIRICNPKKRLRFPEKHGGEDGRSIGRVHLFNSKRLDQPLGSRGTSRETQRTGELPAIVPNHAWPWKHRGREQRERAEWVEPRDLLAWDRSLLPANRNRLSGSFFHDERTDSPNELKSTLEVPQLAGQEDQQYA